MSKEFPKTKRSIKHMHRYHHRLTEPNHLPYTNCLLYMSGNTILESPSSGVVSARSRHGNFGVDGVPSCCRHGTARDDDEKVAAPDVAVETGVEAFEVDL